VLPSAVTKPTEFILSVFADCLGLENNGTLTEQHLSVSTTGSL